MTLLRVSVVVPTRSTSALTTRCLRSLADQGDDVAEVVLVDDASEDDTVERVRDRFPATVVVSNPESVGFTRAANRGLETARGDLLLLLNSDTELPAGSVAALRRAFDRDPRLGVAGGRLHYPDGEPQWSGGNEPGALWAFALASGLPGLLARWSPYRRWRPVRGSAGGRVDWVTGAALACRREVWSRVGSLDERFRFYCQDLDFCLMAKVAGWEVEVLPDFPVLHVHGATIGGVRDSVGNGNPRLLWSDLAAWADKAKSGRAAGRIRWALRAGTRLRLAGLWLARHRHGAAVRDRARVYRDALRAL